MSPQWQWLCQSHKPTAGLNPTLLTCETPQCKMQVTKTSKFTRKWQLKPRSLSAVGWNPLWNLSQGCDETWEGFSKRGPGGFPLSLLRITNPAVGPSWETPALEPCPVTARSPETSSASPLRVQNPPALHRNSGFQLGYFQQCVSGGKTRVQGSNALLARARMEI